MIIVVAFIGTMGAHAAEKAPHILYYGSRAGMEVTVVGSEGLGTSHAMIRAIHTRRNAIAFCRDYVMKVTPKCVQDELKVPLKDMISANCFTGDFTNFYGDRLKISDNPAHGKFGPAYKIVNRRTGRIEDGSYASGYPVDIDLYRALCPGFAPKRAQ